MCQQTASHRTDMKNLLMQFRKRLWSLPFILYYSHKHDKDDIDGTKTRKKTKFSTYMEIIYFLENHIQPNFFFA